MNGGGCGVDLPKNATDITIFQNMSRKERRKKAKELGQRIPANPRKNPAWVQENKDEIISIAAFRAWVEYYGVHLYVMHKSFGFGRKRMEKLFVELAKEYNCIKENETTPQQLKDILKKDTGIDINQLINKYHHIVIGQ